MRAGLRRSVLPAVALGLVASVALPAPGAPLAGSAGIDTSLPATDSKVTVAGRGPFSGLRISVNQTKDLVNQAVSVTWTGGTPTRAGPSRFGAHYLQIMQCWGDPDDTVPENPGPPPEQCIQGASASVYGGRQGLPFPTGLMLSRIISRRGWANFDEGAGAFDSRTGFVWRPFRSVTGVTVGAHTDPQFNPSLEGGRFWLNPYFDVVSTNELPGARTGANGVGAELFEMQTGVEADGLGCGRSVQPAAGGGTRIPRCWLVVVPRGAPADENAGSPFEDSADQFGVYTSPVAPRAWANRVAIPMEFNPIDNACSITSRQRRIGGTELVIGAVASWQPKLCARPGLPPYAYGPVTDDIARQQLVDAPPGSPGLVVMARPIEKQRLDAANPVTYAPIALSGVGIGFNVERNPRPDSEADAQALAGVRVADIRLTPRLVAKLLTQSYTAQVAIKQAPTGPAYAWMAGNPAHLGRDRDFLRFNPEFEQLQIAAAKNFAGLVMPSRKSDAARQVWEWVLADPEARAWLDGAADQWGMKVNPQYATTAAANALGSPFADPAPDSFPKGDPYCYQGPPQGITGQMVPPKLCGTDWLPYSLDLRQAARLTRTADDGAKVVEDPFALTAGEIYRRDTPQVIGTRTILSFTDTASASQYGVQMARLSRAGDNGDDRRFVAPDTAGLTAAVAAMAPKAEPSVREPDPRAVAPDAYPLAVLSYAAVAPLALDAQARTEYGAFVDYAATEGQVAGLQLGQLPHGYAPLPAALREQAAAAAKTIRELKPATELTANEKDEAPAAGTTPAPEVAGISVTTPETAAASAPARSTPGASSGGASAAGGTDGAGAGPLPLQPPLISAPGRSRSGALTPLIAVARVVFALPGLAALALLSAWGALEISKRPRRAQVRVNR